MKKALLILVLALALAIPAIAQEDLEAQRNNIQISNIRINAMIDYARAVFLFQSERFAAEKDRLQRLVDKNNLEINRLTKEIEKTTPPKPAE